MSAAVLLPTPAAASPAEVKARAFLALEHIRPRGNLSLAGRVSRSMGASTNDRFNTYNKAFALPDSVVMARIGHEEETYIDKSTTPGYVNSAFKLVREFKRLVFANLRSFLDAGGEPVDMKADFRRIRREVMAIPLKEPGFAKKEFVSNELVAFLQWFETKYSEVVKEVVRARAGAARAATSAARAYVSTLPIPPTGPVGPSLESRFNALMKPPKNSRRRRAERRQKTRRSQRR
jgi:hypothetical protein